MSMSDILLDINVLSELTHPKFAATALSHDLPLANRNGKDFESEAAYGPFEIARGS